MANYFSEENYENSIIELFCNMGYTHVYGPNVERDFSNPLYQELLEDSLFRINPKLPYDAIKEAIYKLANFENGELMPCLPIICKTASKCGILTRKKELHV